MPEPIELNPFARRVLEVLADLFEQEKIPEHNYDQQSIAFSPHAHCNTAQCILGWADALAYHSGARTGFDQRDWRSLCPTRLFAPYPLGPDRHPTRKQAGRAIRRVLAGEVDAWAEARAEVRARGLVT